MDFNKLLIKKIESILEMSSKFDKICSTILSGNINLDKNNIQNIRELTTLYMTTRAEHGGIIILTEQMKKEVSLIESSMTEKKFSKLYDLSTFMSIVDNINNLVSNMDFEFKKIALMYPKIINNETTQLILLISINDKENKYVKIIDELKNKRPENNYHVIECEKNKEKIDCSEIVGMKLSINVKKLPMMYLINGTNIVELEIEKIKNIENILKILD